MEGQWALDWLTALMVVYIVIGITMAHAGSARHHKHHVNEDERR